MRLSLCLVLASQCALAGAPRDLDALFRSWARALPEPADLSQQNGMSLRCGSRSVTLTLLQATAEKVKRPTDAELVTALRWAKHPDACLRQIAVELIVTAIAFDRNALSVPGMSDPEHTVFHAVVLALARFLEARQAAIPRGTFDGLFVSLSPEDAVKALEGTWVEEAEGKGFQDVVKLGPETIVVTRKHLPRDAKFPDDTWTTALDALTVTPDVQVVVTGRWNEESNSAGFKGSRVVPSQFRYTFWPTAPDVAWFKTNGMSWEKLRRRR